MFEPPTAAKAEIERKEREDGEEPFLGRGGVQGRSFTKCNSPLRAHVYTKTFMDAFPYYTGWFREKGIHNFPPHLTQSS